MSFNMEKVEELITLFNLVHRLIISLRCATKLKNGIKTLKKS